MTPVLCLRQTNLALKNNGETTTSTAESEKNFFPAGKRTNRSYRTGRTSRSWYEHDRTGTRYRLPDKGFGS